jgi:hypothetical protein
MTKFSIVALLALATIIIGCTGSTEHQAQVKIQTLDNPSNESARYPNLHAVDTDFGVMSWLSTVGEEQNALQYASYSSEEWSVPGTVHTGSDFFVNWADFPSVVSYNGKPLAAHWLKKVEGGTFAYHVQLSFYSVQGGWTEPITPHLDRSPTEHGFVSLLPLAADRVLAVWLDGRKTDGRSHSVTENQELHGKSDLSHAMTLRSAEITSDGQIHRKNVIDDAVCDCCQTAIHLSGDQAFVVYRDRSDEEIRDIAIARYDFGTGTWSTPESVHDDNWEIAGCPVNGPRVVSNVEKTAVIWFTAAQSEMKSQIALADNKTGIFSDAIQIDLGSTIGRVDALMRNNGEIWVSWVESAQQEGRIYLRKIEHDGSLSEPILAGITESSRASGFPRIMDTKDGIVVAWTVTKPAFQVITVLVPV